MRSFIRHPVSMPIEFRAEQNENKTDNLYNVSAGGLCFFSDQALDEGTSINIKIPNLKHTFIENCTVVWCNKVKKRYYIGVRFEDHQTAFRMRMIEQLCYIEDYRKQILASEGRELSPKEASSEWIEKYADRFPRF